ncbi:MAG: hypothetical protein K8R88_11910 [Armatimonadetes bacterium]|nr:hypothetical protein [Armatimonadota bacterium]
MNFEAMSLNLLRETAVEPQLDSSFNARVIRLWRVDQQKNGLKYWMPAACGAFVAILALLSIMRLMTTSTPETWKNHKSEARRVDTSNLILIDQDSALRAK